MSNQVRQSSSLKAIQEEPTLADDDIVDSIASNYRTTRKLGKQSKGTAIIVMSDLHEVIIPAGSSFATDDGLTFTSDATYVARTDSEDVITSTDRLMIDNGNSTYSFAINLTAVENGSEYNITRNTRLNPPNIDAFIVNAYASSTFSGGMNDETNAELSTRLAASVSSKTLSNRASVEGLIRALDLDNYDSGFAVSVIGYGDGEQLRYHSIFPVAFGGRVDTYVRTQSMYKSEQVSKTATLVSITDDTTSTWQISFSKDEFPGMYEVTRITLLEDIIDDSVSSFEISSDTRDFDLDESDSYTIVPDIASYTEAVYSRYQIASIRFTDTSTSTDGLTEGTSTASYGVVVSYMPGLAEVQDAVNDRNSASMFGDCLIKAPVPCFVSMTVNISKSTIDPTPSSSDIKASIVSTVNTSGFTNRLPASILVNNIHSLLSGSVVVSSIVMQGRVRRPNGTLLNITSSSVLDVDTDEANMVTSRTVGFFINENDIVVNVSNTS
jgi:hypothetical protein